MNIKIIIIINPDDGKIEKMEHLVNETPLQSIISLLQIQFDDHVGFGTFHKVKAMNPYHYD